VFLGWQINSVFLGRLSSKNPKKLRTRHSFDARTRLADIRVNSKAANEDIVYLATVVGSRRG
jgi:hypothetical protein